MMDMVYTAIVGPHFVSIMRLEYPKAANAILVTEISSRGGERERDVFFHRQFVMIDPTETVCNGETTSSSSSTSIHALVILVQTYPFFLVINGLIYQFYSYKYLVLQ